LPLSKIYDSKNKCYHMDNKEKQLKKFVAQLADITIIGSLGKQIAKEVLIQRLKDKKYCKEDIQWIKANL